MKKTKDYSQLRDLISSAKDVLTGININYDSILGPRTQKLVEISKQIIPIIKEDYPDIAQILLNATQRIVFRTSRILQIPQPPYFQNVFGDFINAYSFGDIRTSIKIIDTLYPLQSGKGHKIFVSHSSKDKEIVSEFCDRILRLGIGINANDIFCTSIEDMDIKNGEDIRNHIKRNILSADFSFLLISDNYKKSEICLNEMGAVWTNDSNVRYYLLPNTGFDKIGWLCDTKKVEQLTNEIALDKLYKELATFYKLDETFETWSKQRVTFIKNVSKIAIHEPVKKIETSVPKILGHVDERILALLKDTPNLSIRDLSVSLGLSEMSIRKHLKQLQNSNRIESNGTARNRKWKIK